MANFTKSWTSSRVDGDSDTMNEVDDFINELYVAISERISDFIYGFATDDSEKDATLKGFFKIPLKKQSSDPSSETDKGILYAKEVNEVIELFYIDDDGNIIQITSGGKLKDDLFRSGDLMLSSNTTPPSGWSDVSSTYNNKFIRISSGTPLQTGGSDTHKHEAGSYAYPNHKHDFARDTSKTSDGTWRAFVTSGYVWGTDGQDYSGYALYDETETDGGGSITGESAEASNVPVYVQVRIFKKD